MTTIEFDSLEGVDFKEKFSNTSSAALVDVRTPAEYASGTIENALNIDFFAPNFIDRFSQLPQDVEYFIFCRSGGRSGQACARLSMMGFKVNNLEGGIGEWPG
jgi:rhodanese-related sulfurtransferase